MAEGGFYCVKIRGRCGVAEKVILPMRAINPAGLYQRAVHADGLRGQQVVALSQGILQDAGNHPAKAPAADDPWLHHCGLQGGSDGPHEHRLPFRWRPSSISWNCPL